MNETENVLRQYQAALEAFRSGQYEQAKTGVRQLCLLVPDWPKPFLLQAYIERTEGAWTMEVETLLGLLRRIDTRRQENCGLAAEAWSMLGSAWSMIGQAGRAVVAYRTAMQLEPDQTQKLIEGSNANFAANYVADFTPTQFRNGYRAYAALLAGQKRLPVRTYAHKRLRIGYLAANFREHPLAFFLWPLLHFQDRSRFEVYCYAANTRQDAVTDCLRREVEHWIDIAAMTDAEAAAVIQQDEIDILLELDGHTEGNRLPVLSCRPAPVQIAGIGYMGSTGLPDVDYFLTDSWCLPVPATSQAFFTEKLLALPVSHLCYAPLKQMPLSGGAPCQQNGYVTFGCFNNFSKVTDELLGAWAAILSALPEARLIVKHRVFDSREGCRISQERMQAAGLPLARVDCRGFSREYLREYSEVDIALDTYPYTGALTTCEALFMGVPVISRYGLRPGSCFGRSILANVGLGELAGDSAAGYIRLAVELGRDASLIAALHDQLRGMMLRSPLMDGRRYARDVETVFERIERGLV